MRSSWSQKVSHLVLVTVLSASQLQGSIGFAASTPKGANDLQRWAEQNSSSGLMTPDSLQVIKDNDHSFQEKLRIIRNAQAGDALYLNYYIHADDETTSLLNQELIKAARRGAKVNLLLDFITNYSRLDMFNMMTDLGKGNMDIRFFNPPTATIHEDVMYMTTNCKQNPAQCVEEKNKNVQEAKKISIAQKGKSNILGEGTFFSRAFLAALTTKNAGLLKDVLMASGTIPDMSANKEEMTPEKQEKLVDFLKILVGAKVLRSTGDQIKLAVAAVLYKDDVGPILEMVDKAAPFKLKKDNPSGKDWEEITQFTHHKMELLIKADRNSMEELSGGRNLENSYHANENQRSLVHKYLFYDTDIRTSSTKREDVLAMEKAAETFFNYDKLVVKLKDLNSHMPVDLAMEAELMKQVIEETKALKEDPKVSANQYDQAAEKLFQQKLKETQGTQKRRDAQFKKMREGIERYNANYQSRDLNVRSALPSMVEDLDKNDKDVKVAYFENLPFDDGGRFARFKNAIRRGLNYVGFSIEEKDYRRRVYDPVAGKELASNKGIHAAWIKMIEDQAAKAKAEGKRRPIVIDMGYVLLPSNMVDLMARLMDGRIDASFIDLTFISNSIPTTDLSALNVMARHQLKALMDYYIQQKGKPGALGSLEFYEHKLLEEGKITSQHSKAIYTLDGFFIGSANGDVRSYETDTNNGMLVMDAPNTAKRMMDRIQKEVIANPRLLTRVTDSFKKNHSEFLKEDITLVRQIVSKYKGIAGRVEGRISEISQLLIQQMTKVYLTTGLIANPDRQEAKTWLGRQSTVQAPGASVNSLSHKALICRQVFDISARREHLNTQESMNKMIDSMGKNGNQKRKGDFDRALQLF